MQAQLFYKELGRLLYAVAAVDGTVSPKEVETIKRVVKKRLVPVEAGMDHFGSDQAYITEFEFDVLFIWQPLPLLDTIQFLRSFTNA